MLTVLVTTCSPVPVVAPHPSSLVKLHMRAGVWVWLKEAHEHEDDEELDGDRALHQHFGRSRGGGLDTRAHLRTHVWTSCGAER